MALGDSLTDGDSSGDAPVTGISVSVRVEGTSAAGRLSFQVDDVGWTGVRDGRSLRPVRVRNTWPGESLAMV